MRTHPEACSFNETKLDLIFLSSLTYRFKSTQTEGEELTSLDDYIARMEEKQTAIYYLPGDNIESLRKSPLLQKYEKHDIEVLLLDDPIDEFCMQHLSEYEKNKLKSIAKEDSETFDKDEDSKKKQVRLKEMYKPLTDWWKQHLGQKVEKVAVSSRLVEEPAFIFTSQYGYSAHMEKINRG